MSVQCAGFLKFAAEEQHLVDLVENGHIFINSLQYFSDCAVDANGRYDQYEMAISYEKIEKLTIGGRDFTVVENKEKPAKIIEACTHLYSLYSIDFDSDAPAIDGYAYDPRLWDEFGISGDGYLLLIHDPKEFKKRLYRELEKRPYYVAGKVEYVDPESFNGYGGAFRKRIQFSHQNEFRVVLTEPTFEDPITDIYLGDISDIASGPVHRQELVNSYNAETGVMHL